MLPADFRALPAHKLTNMLGWINDCVEKLVIEKFGLDAWHVIKQKAGCDVKDGGFLKLDHYTDQSTIDLVVAASEVSGLSVDQVLEAFGAYFVPYIINEGYENLLCCQGSTLKDWMANINAIHQHLQMTFPKKMIMPQFWCIEEEDGALSLHYFSQRGNHLAPIAKGLVMEVARYQFELDIVMDKQATQGVDGAKFTMWRVTTENIEDLWKLTAKQGGRNGIPNAPTKFTCPFSGIEADLSEVSCPHASSPSSIDSSNSSYESSTVRECPLPETGGLSPAITKRLFPYHVILGDDLRVTQIGKDLAKVLEANEDEIIGKHVAYMLDITQPQNAEWSWPWLLKLEDQKFTVEPELFFGKRNLRLNGSAMLLSESPRKVMLVLCPDANNLDELRQMDLTLSDLPVHGAQRDSIFLREHLSTQMNNALKMEKLSKSLEQEKALLESLLPHHAAEGLRQGRAVEPRLHNNVTMFFSDIVGFTNICEQIYPWDIIAMLNKLYCLMDYLALKFKLFKVETIGDAYVCCSGLPLADENHAENVANFAVAVNHCARQVKSPVDGAPIQLRIGVHTGPCASGVVGVTNPRYCVFGDTVNTTSRHESTGMAGKVHCSKETREELARKAKTQFKLVERGLVEMKGKGQRLTYWLESRASNRLVNAKALERLEKEVAKLLAETNFETPSATEEEAMICRKRSLSMSNTASLYDLRREYIVKQDSSSSETTDTCQSSSDSSIESIVVRTRLVDLFTTETPSMFFI